MSECLLCDYDKEEWQSPKAILELFKLCPKHQQEMRETKMAQCSKCGNQDMEWKEGTAKSTGKPWKAWYCAPCKLMHGMNGIPWGQKQAPAPTRDSRAFMGKTPVPSSSIEKKLDMILEILHDNFGQKPEELTTDNTPF